MNEEKMLVLRLLEEKKISSDKALQLLEALGKPATESPGGKGRALRIRVYEDGGAEPKVNINAPLGWAKFMAPFIGGKIKAKLADKGYDVGLAKIREAIGAREPVKIGDVQDGGTT